MSWTRFYMSQSASGVLAFTFLGVSGVFVGFMPGNAPAPQPPRRRRRRHLIPVYLGA